MDDPAPHDRDGGTASLHGLILVAGLLTATPIAMIREVVPRPPALQPFPSHRREVRGAIDLRGQRIPVIDLAAVLGLPVNDDPASSPVVAILRHEGRVFGALVEATAGVIALDDATLTGIDLASSNARLSTAEVPVMGQAAVTAGFIVGELTGVVLDCGYIARLEGMPLVRERLASAAHHLNKTLPTLVFRVGTLRAAIPASCVDATVPWQTILPPPTDAPPWIGMLPYNGAEIPVVDTLRILGQGQLPAGRSSGAAIVIRTTTTPASADGSTAPPATPARQGLVALLIDGIDDIVRLTGADVHGINHSGLPGSALSKGIAICGGLPCLLLDEGRIAADRQLVQLSQIEQRAPGAGQTIGAGRRGGDLSLARAGAPLSGAPLAATPLAGVRPYLVLRLGEARFSVPLEQVEEILPAGQDVIELPDNGDGLRGLFSHRGQAVPLVDLACCLGLAAMSEASAPPGFVVIARETTAKGLRRTAFSVDALCSVDRIAPQVMGVSEQGKRHAGVPHHTIRLGDGHASTVLDFNELAARFDATVD
ncbi:chemotaxis protein CheW [Novosphingobium sp. FKTRR1]|uniref:chemotaxis protein CheW n=1 Tax=Novosphingobium sp. FKTRR1 TaxID=2879118 RepID=UPI001CEFBB62|nr:chemotaxis protein CheW [Novosphingobium sp. FKTRR1]